MSYYEKIRIEREKELVEEVQSFHLKPLVILEEYKGAKTLVKCETKEGYLVQTNVDRLRSGKTPNPFVGPYATDNLKVVVEKNEMHLIEGQEYEAKDKSFKVKHRGFEVETSLKEIELGKVPSPFEKEKPYGVKNMKKVATTWASSFKRYIRDFGNEKFIQLIQEVESFGLRVLDMEEWKAIKTTFVCRDRNGMKVRTSLDKLKAGKTPNPFKKNPYALENADVLAWHSDTAKSILQRWRHTDSWIKRWVQAFDTCERAFRFKRTQPLSYHKSIRHRKYSIVV